ncbi:hypothetical protein C5S31_03370 [ANME-1 cluster archaeon GoMg2]|nr:hypothetical protein [ANME-1 cluster archaeon GoMg2]
MIRNGFYFPTAATTDEKQIIEVDVEKTYRILSDLGCTSYGKRSVKKEIMAALFFISLPDDYLSQFHSNTTDFDVVTSGLSVLNKKAKKQVGYLRPFDNFWYFIHDYERISKSFKNDVSIEVRSQSLETARLKVGNLYDRLCNENQERFLKNAKGVNADFLFILMYWYTIRKSQRGLLKPQKELAIIWNIPTRTFKRKMAFLKAIDIPTAEYIERRCKLYLDLLELV